MFKKQLSGMKKRNIVAVLFIAVIIIASVIVTVIFQKPSGGSQKEITLVLDFGQDGLIKKYRTRVTDSEQIKAWSLLQQAVAYGGVDLKIHDGFVPVEINGLPSAGNAGQSWQLYVNSEKREFKPFNVLVRGGDNVIFKLE